jgi:hypothetical protein
MLFGHPSSGWENEFLSAKGLAQHRCYLVWLHSVIGRGAVHAGHGDIEEV